MARPTVDKSEQRGYDYKFVQQPPEPLICRLCRLPAREPRLSKCCRYNFCESCLVERANTKSSKLITCPICSDYDFRTDVNRQARMEVLSLQVYCPNKAMGCSWRGKIPDITNHMIKDQDGCPVVSVKCRCGKTVVRGNLTEHYRNDCPLTPQMTNCPYCEVRGEKQVIEGEHKEQCCQYPLNCPNNCGITNIPREQLAAHMNDECSMQPVACEYVNVGCAVKVYRKDVLQHSTEYATHHLHLVRASLATTDDEIVATKQKVSQVTNQLATTHSDFTNVLLQVAGMVETLAENNSQRGRIFGQKHWQVWLHCRSLQSSSKCIEAPVVVRMTDYEYKKRCKEVWYSEAFWSHHNGYKVQLKLHANGFGDFKGTHLSMGICIKEGPNDKHLAWPVQGTFKVTLLNQIADDNQHHIDRVVFSKNTPHHIGGRTAADDERVSAWGKCNFITHDQLFKTTPSCCYLRNDVIYIHISFKRH